MPVNIVYDKDGNKVPSREFFSTLIILLRKCQMETGSSLVAYLEDLEQESDDLSIDAYEDKTLVKAVQKQLFDNYPDSKPIKKNVNN